MSPHRGNNFRQFVNFLAQVKQGEVDGVKVRLHRLQSLISSSYIEHLECTRDEDLDTHLHHSLMYVDEATQLLHDYHMTTTHLSHNCHMTITAVT